MSKIIQIMPAGEWMLRCYQNVEGESGGIVRERQDEPLVGWGLTEDGVVIPLAWDGTMVVDAGPSVDNNDIYLAQEWQVV